MASEDDEYKGVLKVLRELHEAWGVYQAQLTGEIVEYKKTVNNAISLLATEAFKHQSDTTKRLEDDAIERRNRQAVVDTATANVREELLSARAETRQLLDASAQAVREEMLNARAETLQRLDTSNAHSATHERRAGRERLGISIGMGCLALLMLIMLLVLVALIAALYWKPV